jgi:hypothetical protein
MSVNIDHAYPLEKGDVILSIETDETEVYPSTKDEPTIATCMLACTCRSLIILILLAINLLLLKLILNTQNIVKLFP